MSNTITERELATIRAALRFWQSNTDDAGELANIASDGGQFVALGNDEIDMLAERLNFGCSSVVRCTAPGHEAKHSGRRG